MKKILFLSIITLFSLVFKSLSATNNSLDNPYKIIERKAPEKHFKLNKNSLKEIFDLEPENSYVEIELPYFNETEKFQIEKSKTYDSKSIIYTRDGHFFNTKKYFGVHYKIRGLDGIYHGTLNLYPEDASLDIDYKGKNIKIENNYTAENSTIRGFDIQNSKLKDFKNIKDLLLNIEKEKLGKFASEKDSLIAENVKTEIKQYIKEEEKNKNQDYKPFEASEITTSTESPNMLSPPPPPIPLAGQNRCQQIYVNYNISYNTYLQWQRPKLSRDGNYVWQSDTAIKTGYDSLAVVRVTQRLNNYFTRVRDIFEEEGITLTLGLVAVDTYSWDYLQMTYEGVFAEGRDKTYFFVDEGEEKAYSAKYMANQFFDYTRQWKEDIGDNIDVNSSYAQIPEYGGKNATGLSNEMNAFGIYSILDGVRTEGKIAGIGLNSLIDVRLNGGKRTINSANNGIRHLFVMKRIYTGQDTSITDSLDLTIGMNEGLHFYIGDLVCSSPNTAPETSYNLPARDKNTLKRFTGTYSDLMTPQPRIGESVFGGFHEPFNFLPMLSNPQEGGTPYTNWSIPNIRVTPNGCHLKDIGASNPILSTPTYIYGYPNNAGDHNKRLGFIPLLGSREYHTYDYDYQGGNLHVTDTSMTRWNLKDHEELFGEPEEYGDTDYPPFDIDKWNTWMLVHHVATSLGARYFKTEDNRNSILAPLARNYNYDANNYNYHYKLRATSSDPNNPSIPNGYYEKPYIPKSTQYVTWEVLEGIGTPHISGAYPSGLYRFYVKSWADFWGKRIYKSRLFRIFAFVTVGMFATAAAGTTGGGIGATTWGALSGMSSFGATLWNVWFVVAAAFAAYVILDFLGTGFMTGFNIDNVVKKGTNPKYPKVYQGFTSMDDPSEYSYYTNVWGDYGTEFVGVDNWDVRYSFLDLNLENYIQSQNSPVDLVSWSKGFDRKTADLIRLNLTNEYVTGWGPHATPRDDPNSRMGVFSGHPRPYARINIRSNYMVSGDTLRATTDRLNVRKDNTLSSYQEIDAHDVANPGLANYFGAKMKARIYTDNSLLFDWRYNGTSISDSLSAKRFLPTTDTVLKIYPITLRTRLTTNGVNCFSNTAKEFVRVYPRRFIPSNFTFTGAGKWFGGGNTSLALKNWEFIGPWSVGDGSTEARLWPNSTNGYYSRGFAPWNGNYISNTGWTRQNINNTYTALTYMPLNEKSIANNSGNLIDDTQEFKGNVNNLSPKSKFKNWYSKWGLVDLDGIFNDGFYGGYWDCAYLNPWFTTRRKAERLGYHFVSSDEANSQPWKYTNGRGWYKCTLVPYSDGQINSGFGQDGTGQDALYPSKCSLGYYRQGTADTARSPLYQNDLPDNNRLNFSFTYSNFYVDTAMKFYPPNWPIANQSGYKIGGTPDTLEVWANLTDMFGNVTRKCVWKKGGRDLNTLDISSFTRTGNPASPYGSTGPLQNRPTYTNGVTAGWQPAFTLNTHNNPRTYYYRPRTPAERPQDWRVENISLDQDDAFCRYIQMDFVYKNYSGNESKLYIDRMGFVGAGNFPIPLCGLGAPVISWDADTQAVESPTNPLEASWTLRAFSRHNIKSYKIYIKQNGQTNYTLLTEGNTNLTLSYDNNGDPFYPGQPSSGTPVILASGSIPTKVGTTYTMYAVVSNTETVQVGPNTVKVTDFDSLFSNYASTYQKSLNVMPPKFIPDSTYNRDNTFTISVSNQGIPNQNGCYSCYKLGIDRYVLQEYRMVNGDLMWVNVGNVRQFNPFNTGQTLLNAAPEFKRFTVTNLTNGVRKFRIFYFGTYSIPQRVYSQEWTITTCLGCPGIKPPQVYYSTLEPNFTPTAAGGESNGRFKIITRLPAKHNTRVLKLIQKQIVNNNEVLTTVKTRNIPDTAVAYFFTDTLNRISQGFQQYQYYAEGSNPTFSNSQGNKVNSNELKVSVFPSCNPNVFGIDENKILTFDINSNVCSDLKYSVIMYKMNSNTNLEISASDSTLTPFQIPQLIPSTTPIPRFSTLNNPISLTNGEVSASLFKREIQNPTTLNSWYRIDVSCMGCTQNNTTSIYYYFKNN